MCRPFIAQCFLCCEILGTEEYPCSNVNCLGVSNDYGEKICDECVAQCRTVDADTERRQEKLARRRQEAIVLEMRRLEEAARQETERMPLNEQRLAHHAVRTSPESTGTIQT